LNIAEGDGGRQQKIDDEFPPPPDVIDALSGWKGIEFVDARCGVAVIFGRRHDAISAIAGVKGSDADHQSDNEV
jgi:hypothetical protein